MNTIEEDIEQAKDIVEIHGRDGCEDSWQAVMGRLATEVERLLSENLRLRVKLNSEKIAELE